jgi:hypothetical protein
MERLVEPELLDELPPADPRAIASRRDLHRLNGWMGHAPVVSSALRDACGAAGPSTIVELGAGDGRFALRLALALSDAWPDATIVLVDRQPFDGAEADAAIARRGWRCERVCADVFHWLVHAPAGDREWLVANLFLHHFTDAQLGSLFAFAAGRCAGLVACEPRRSSFVAMLSRLVGWVGCNDVSRHDAVVSVRAGFKSGELSALWPDSAGWRLQERDVRLASHSFVARRLEGSVRAL